MMQTGSTFMNLRDVPHAGFTVVGDRPLRLLTVHVVDKTKPLYEWVKQDAWRAKGSVHWPDTHVEHQEADSSPLKGPFRVRRVVLLLVGALAGSLLLGLSKSSAQALESVQRLSAHTVYHLMSMATKGNVDAEEAIGLKYAYAEGVDWDPKKGIRWLRRAAEHGSADAQCALGRVYEGGVIPSGQSLPSDYDESVKWYGRAAEQGWCWLQLAQAYEDKASADGERRDVAAYHRDMKAAAYWWRREAGPRSGYPTGYPYAKFSHGNPVAQWKMGYLHQFGMGVPQSYLRAWMWYRRAAEQGWGDAFVALGRMYESGQGVPEDDELAYVFFGLAPEFLGPQCDRCTDPWLKSLSGKLSPEQLERARAMIGEWRVGMPLPAAAGASQVPRHQ